MNARTEDPTTTSASTPAEARVRALIATRYAVELAAVGVPADELPDDLDLRAAGVIDSLGFLELVVGLEQELGTELDFETLDPDQLTTVGPLARHVAEQAAAAPQGA